MKTLGRLDRVDLRSCWGDEARESTPWLAQDENLRLLDETVGLDLELERTEASVGTFKADIVAREIGTENRVIIENQLDRTDHDHLGKLITYASGLAAKTVIWIAGEINPEHRRALDWLNEVKEAQLNMGSSDTHRVIHVWTGTGQVCTPDGVRTTRGQQKEWLFDTRAEAEAHCEKVQRFRPFVECWISGPGCEARRLVNDAHKGRCFKWDGALGRYCVRLFEWLSGASVRLDGTYLTADEPELCIEFPSLWRARRFCRRLARKHPNVECWIYGPDGHVVSRGGTRVRMDESGLHTVNQPWWAFWW